MHDVKTIGMTSTSLTIMGVAVRALAMQVAIL